MEHTKSVTLSALRPFAVALGYPVTVEGLVARLDQEGAQRTPAEEATADEPAFLASSLPDLLRRAVEDSSPSMLAFLRLQRSSQAGAARSNRFRAAVSGNPELLIAAAEAARVPLEELMNMLLSGDAITIRVAEVIAEHFGAKLTWLLGLDLHEEMPRH